MKIWRYAAGFAALCGVVLAAQVGVAGGDATYTIIIKKVEVKTTQKNGNSWDVNDGKPDLRVIIRNTSDSDSKAYETKEKTDTYTADFDEPTNIKFKKGQTLEFQVVDVDVAVNDVIGKTLTEMKEKNIGEGKLRLENFEQVIFLEFQVKKL